MLLHELWVGLLLLHGEVLRSWVILITHMAREAGLGLPCHLLQRLGSLVRMVRRHSGVFKPESCWFHILRRLGIYRDVARLVDLVEH